MKEVKNINILHLNTYTKSNNLSFPHYKFHKMLEQAGHNSLLVSVKGDVEEENIKFLKKSLFSNYLLLSQMTRKLLFEKFNKSNHYFYPEWNLENINLKHIINNVNFKPDIIITYFTKFSFNQKLLYELSSYYKAPVLTVAIDESPLTGGCHFTFGCTRYKEKCGKCPALNSNKEFDLSRENWEVKKKFIDKTDITLLSCSSNFTKQIKESPLYKNKNIEELILAVDENTFDMKDKYIVRKELGIEKSKKVIFFGAVNLKDTRKGLVYLIEALKLFKEKISDFERKNILLLVAGNGIDEIDIPFEYKLLGYLKDEESLAKGYQAADLFISPSVEDLGPLMVNQSIMCGRPVVAFDIGISLDLVYSGRTGYRAKLKDSNDLAEGIKMILSLNENKWNEMSQNCRNLGLELFSLKSQGEKLTQIISKVMANSRDN